MKQGFNQVKVLGGVINFQDDLNMLMFAVLK